MPQALLVECAPAKVNLFLHVVGRRPDGYHLLDSLAVFPGAADRLMAGPAPGLTLTVTGPFGDGLDAGPDNLVLRAARALAEKSGVTAGAALVLDKRLPVASGIGGGSADAAAALRLLSRLWSVGLPGGALQELALALGADVPVCIAGQAARMGGTGDLLSPAPALPPFGAVLVNPGIAVSTPEVFRARAGPFSGHALLPQSWPDAAAMACDLSALGNDLETPALRLCPAVGDVLAWLRAQPGCLLARMSGSGATCFGLFPSGSAASAVADRAPPPWWAWGGGFTDRPRSA
ncbi:MAG TPA: 4-(cytidine 5'-diphospho)-2-C-methyl-D-erythritol kinase [Acetobacteraceae bacterium]